MQKNNQTNNTTNTTLKVYLKDSTKLITQFQTINEEKYYKIYLTNLQGTNDTFDLQIINENNNSATYLLFDHIIDPTEIIKDVGAANSTTDNITKQDNFTHLSISQTGPINDSSLHLYAPFDTNTTTLTYDYTTYDNDGTLVGNLIWNDNGVFGGAYEFDGLADSINFGNNFGNLSKGTTMMAWVKWSGLAGNQFIFSYRSSSGSRIQMFYTGGVENYIASLFYDGSVFTKAGTGPVFVDTWYHVALTKNDTSLGFYLNGTFFDGTGGSAQSAGATRVVVGKQGGSELLFFNGTMDEVMVFNRSLSSAEILDIYNNGTNRFFSRGEQIFENNNVSESDDENRINITINSTQLFDSQINVSVGDVSGDSYSYGTEASFTDGAVKELVISTPNNISLKFIFYAGNETNINDFYSPTLENNIIIDSWKEAVDVPSFANISETPANGSAYSPSQFYEFNITITDENSSIETVIITFNNTNYSTTANEIYNLSNVFSFNQTGLAAAKYNYTWHANDTSGNNNKTLAQEYTVLKANATTNLTLDGNLANLTITVNENVNITADLITGEANIQLLQDGTSSTKEAPS